jgi:hypothetical protein
MLLAAAAVTASRYNPARKDKGHTLSSSMLLTFLLTSAAAAAVGYHMQACLLPCVRQLAGQPTGAGPAQRG